LSGRNSVRQRDLRAGLVEAMKVYLVEEKMDDLLNCFELGDPSNPVFDLEIEKAMDSAYYSISKALKEISRIAVRVGYIDKETHYNKE
jgi:hypothetical protein